MGAFFFTNWPSVNRYWPAGPIGCGNATCVGKNGLRQLTIFIAR